MTVELTIQVPDSLSKDLQHLEDRLPEILERGLRELLAEAPETIQDERTIIEVLTSRPSPEQILALRPSLELQTRASELLSRGKQATLSSQEAAELERYLLLEHLVRMAKANAYRHRAQGV